MRASKGTDDRGIGSNFDSARMGANELDKIAMGKLCDEQQGVDCIPSGTLAERVIEFVTGFMEKYEESLHA